MKLKKFGEFETARVASLKEEDKDLTSPWLIENGERQILGVQWRTAGKWGTVGIVAVKNIKMNYWTAYMGMLQSEDQKADAEAISQWGSGMTENEARAFFPFLKEEKYKDS